MSLNYINLARPFIDNMFAEKMSRYWCYETLDNHIFIYHISWDPLSTSSVLKGL